MQTWRLAEIDARSAADAGLARLPLSLVQAHGCAVDVHAAKGRVAKGEWSRRLLGPVGLFVVGLAPVL